MISAMKNRLLFLPALLLWFPLALAQAPTGSVSFTIDPSAFPVWNFTGAYQFSNQQIVGNEAVLPLSFPVSITHDLAGRLSGAGTTIVTLGQDVAAAHYVVEGTVSGGGNSTRAAFTVTLAGSGLDLIAGAPRSYKISLAYNLRVDAGALAWVAPEHGAAVTGSAQISGVGGGIVVQGDDLTVAALPPGVDGGWSVNMDILALSRLGGTATVVIHSSAAPDRAAYLPGTLTLNANLAGTFKLGSSQILLTGLAESRPTTLQLTLVKSLANGETRLGRIAGKVLGQTVSWPPVAP
jgi:hypothetical protein